MANNNDFLDDIDADDTNDDSSEAFGQDADVESLELAEKKALLKTKIQSFELELASAPHAEKKKIKALIKDLLDELNELRNTSLDEADNDSADSANVAIDSATDSAAK